MNRIRSVLWVGRGDRFAAELAADAPLLDVVWECDPSAAARLDLGGFHAVVLDAEDTDEALRGLAALAAPLPAPILVRLERADSEAEGALLEAGAAGVVTRSERDLVARLGGLARAGSPRGAAPAGDGGNAGIVAVSSAMQEVLALVPVAGRSLASVLITGETGTGKELVARAVHRASRRRERPFVALNCAALPETLLESELFGHVRGAFTGAERDRAGLFESADGGSLFLDEVGETSAAFQAKLLRVLQERELRPVGGLRARSVDVRVIAATHRDLRGEIARGRFREDLYYRLAVLPIHIPPLRERPADVAPLAEHFLAHHGPGEGKPGARLTPEALHLLQAQRWPGNVRELENEIHRALALAPAGAPLGPEHFSTGVTRVLEPLDAPPPAGESLRETLDRVEAWLIRRALAREDGRRACTARALGITREGLYKKMKRLGIE